MGRLVHDVWPSDEGIERKHRRLRCEFLAYVPDPLAGRSFTFSGECAADIADAEAAIRRLNASARTLVDADALAPLLLRAEAAASSRIEGLEIGARRLLHAEAARELEVPGRRDVIAHEVLCNVDAMSEAVALADSEPTVTVQTIFDIHRQVLAVSPKKEFAGKVRPGRSWIGGSPHDPCTATYVPPPAAYVPELLEDLAAFCNDDSLPAVAQAAIAHAQFENIHPFVDGNGRTGRALIHIILRRRGLAPHIVPPISLVLATFAKEYIKGLTSFRYEGEPDSPEAIEGLNMWVGLFASACVRSVRDATAFEKRVRAIQSSWRERLSPVRRNSSVDLLIEALPGTVILTATRAADLLGRSFRAANLAIEELVAAGVLRQVSVGRRNRAFEAVEVIDAFTALERRLASPADDTHVAPPVRPVPKRRG